MKVINVDVAIIGGGPGGSTCASILRKYAPHLSVLVLEREQFPRDHVGESQLPPISKVLDEIGAWEKIEAANFPIKLGATYKWGRTKELWDFEFFPAKQFRDEPRPAKYEGQRRWTAFQVDRAIYDEILLDHAEELGAEVRQQTKVLKVNTTGEKVDSLTLESGEEVQAKFYVDASGHSGVLRRAVGVEVDQATALQNIAIWDYWQNTEWAVNIGVGGTRVQVMSVGFGWLWFIPLGPTRTSVGLVVPASYYKSSGKRPEELYREAIEQEPTIADLMRNATSEDKLSTTKDWSFASTKHSGENWFLVGEAGGFADPILAAGLSLTHVSAREAAITMIELFRNKFDPAWLHHEYGHRQSSRIRSHIRFAEYWYTANSQFSELQEFTQTIAEESGLNLEPDKAWAWLAQGGFVDYDGNLGIAGFSTDQIKTLGEFLSEVGTESIVKTCNVFVLNLEGVDWHPRAVYGQGQVIEGGCYSRDGKTLPLTGVFSVLIKMLCSAKTTPQLIEQIKEAIAENREPSFVNDIIGRIPHALEALVTDGWVIASYDPQLEIRSLPERIANVIHWNTDNLTTRAGVASE